jgi:hypothetical protein
LKGTWKGILEVSAFLVYYITVLCSSTSQITRTSQQVWRVHLVYVASGITSSRQSSLADRPAFLPGTGITSSRQSSLADRSAFLPGTGPLRGAVISHASSVSTCRATSAGGQTNLSRHIRRRTDQPFTTGHASSTTKRGALKWLTQEADAMNWSSPKHVQPEEGRKEPAPRAIRFRKSRVETTIRERAGSSQEGRKRAKDTPGYFLCFFFSLHS